MEKDKQLLSGYIDNVLYHPEKASIDVTALDQEYRQLGQQIKRLADWAMEADQFAGEVAQGKLDEPVKVDEKNVFARNIREIMLVLRQITGQIEQIVAQTPGEEPEDELSSYDFDAMVRELRRRTSALENERNLFIRFTENASERIIVLDEETGDMVFANKVAREFREKTMGYVDEAFSINAQSGCTFRKPYSQWLHTVRHPDENGEMVTEYYRVHSIYIMWENRGAVAHMFSNVTELQRIQELAQKDSLTGAFNRGYAMEYLERLYAQGTAFAMAFVDVDYLKYCNDGLGHNEGDGYLLQVVALLRGVGEENVVCRTGGDEFLLISQTMDAAQLTAALTAAREMLRGETFKPDGTVRKSFSFGVVSHTPGDEADLQKLLSEADERMYQNKLENKKRDHQKVMDDRLPSQL